MKKVFTLFLTIALFLSMVCFFPALQASAADYSLSWPKSGSTIIACYNGSGSTLVVYDINGNTLKRLSRDDAIPTQFSITHYTTIQNTRMFKVSFTQSGTKYTGYVPVGDLSSALNNQLATGSSVLATFTANKSIIVRANCFSGNSTNIGNITAGDYCYVLSEKNGMKEVVYPCGDNSTKQFKLGWCSAEMLKDQFVVLNVTTSSNLPVERGKAVSINVKATASGFSSICPVLYDNNDNPWKKANGYNLCGPTVSPNNPYTTTTYNKTFTISTDETARLNPGTTYRVMLTARTPSGTLYKKKVCDLYVQADPTPVLNVTTSQNTPVERGEAVSITVKGTATGFKSICPVLYDNNDNPWKKANGYNLCGPTVSPDNPNATTTYNKTFSISADETSRLNPGTTYKVMLTARTPSGTLYKKKVCDLYVLADPVLSVTTIQTCYVERGDAASINVKGTATGFKSICPVLYDNNDNPWKKANGYNLCGPTISPDNPNVTTTYNKTFAISADETARLSPGTYKVMLTARTNSGKLFYKKVCDLCVPGDPVLSVTTGANVNVEQGNAVSVTVKGTATGFKSICPVLYDQNDNPCIKTNGYNLCGPTVRPENPYATTTYNNTFTISADNTARLSPGTYKVMLTASTPSGTLYRKKVCTLTVKKASSSFTPILVDPKLSDTSRTAFLMKEKAFTVKIKIDGGSEKAQQLKNLLAASNTPGDGVYLELWQRGCDGIWSPENIDRYNRDCYPDIVKARLDVTSDPEYYSARITIPSAFSSIFGYYTSNNGRLTSEIKGSLKLCPVIILNGQAMYAYGTKDAEMNNISCEQTAHITCYDQSYYLDRMMHCYYNSVYDNAFVEASTGDLNCAGYALGLADFMDFGEFVAHCRPYEPGESIGSGQRLIAYFETNALQPDGSNDKGFHVVIIEHPELCYVSADGKNLITSGTTMIGKGAGAEVWRSSNKTEVPIEDCYVYTGN